LCRGCVVCVCGVCVCVCVCGVCSVCGVCIEELLPQSARHSA